MKKYSIIYHREELNFDQHCKLFPSEIIEKYRDIEITKQYIYYSPQETKIVFFVDENGDHFGQYATIEEATERFNFIKSISKEERKKHDQ